MSDRLVEAWKKNPKNADKCLSAAMALSDSGQQSQAIDLIQQYIQLNGVSGAALQVAGKIAFEIEAYEAAETLYRKAIDLTPSDAAVYLNLVGALDKLAKYDEAIELLQSSLPLFPGSAKLWFSVGQILDHRDGPRIASLTFYQEACRLDPTDYHSLTAYANRLGMAPQAKALYQQAVKVDGKQRHAHVGLAIYNFAMGDLAGAWPHYEYRLHPSGTAHEVATYAVRAPMWKGQALKGKSIFVMAEQGIGDEVFFSASLPRLYEEAEQLIIGCDPRLVSIYQRTFRRAIVGGFEDNISEGKRRRSFTDIEAALRLRKIRPDYACPIGSVGRYYWPSIENLPQFPEGILQPDQSLVEQFAKRINISSGRLKVGVSWESGKLSGGRKHFYPGLERLKPLFSLPDIDFYVLQYSCDSELVSAFAKDNGFSIYQFDDIDLKADVEANLAIMASLDLVIGPPTATQVFAQACGCVAWTLSDGLPWTAFGQKDGRVPMFPKARLFNKDPGFWAPLVDRVMGALVSSMPTLAKRQEPAQLSGMPEHWEKEYVGSELYDSAHTPVTPTMTARIEMFLKDTGRFRVGLAPDDLLKRANETGVNVWAQLAPLFHMAELDICLLSDEIAEEDIAEYLPRKHDHVYFYKDIFEGAKVGGVPKFFPYLDIIVAGCGLIACMALDFGKATYLLDDLGAWQHLPVRKSVDKQVGASFRLDTSANATGVPDLFLQLSRAAGVR